MKMHVKYFNIFHIILCNICVKTCGTYVNDALLCSLLFKAYVYKTTHNSLSILYSLNSLSNTRLFMNRPSVSLSYHIIWKKKSGLYRPIQIIN